MRNDEMPMVEQELLAAVPRLRAIAVGLCGRSDRADDLVQETFLRAWANLSGFQPGTNLVAWLYTILRNQFYSEIRKRHREVEDSDDHIAARQISSPRQESRLELQDLRAALARLEPHQREAVLLVGAAGLSYEHGARLCNCAVGTMKSRVSRARTQLAAIMEKGPGRRGNAIIPSEARPD